MDSSFAFWSQAAPRRGGGFAAYFSLEMCFPFRSCLHGSGRLLSRTAAIKQHIRQEASGGIGVLYPPAFLEKSKGFCLVL